MRHASRGQRHSNLNGRTGDGGKRVLSGVEPGFRRTPSAISSLAETRVCVLGRLIIKAKMGGCKPDNVGEGVAALPTLHIVLTNISPSVTGLWRLACIHEKSIKNHACQPITAAEIQLLHAWPCASGFFTRSRHSLLTRANARCLHGSKHSTILRGHGLMTRHTMRD